MYIKLIQNSFLGSTRGVRNFSSTIIKSAKTPVTTISEELASKSPQLVTLHNRLHLPNTFKLSTLARCLTCIQENGKYANNKGLSVFGKNLLTYHATEYLLMKYPRIPLAVLNNAVNSIIGEEVLYGIGKDWGIEFDTTTEHQKYLKDEEEHASIGKLRFTNKHAEVETNLVEFKNIRGLSPQNAMSSAVKSIIGGYYAGSKSLTETKDFIHKYILTSKHLNMQEFFSFEQPTRELSILCQREGLEAPVSRLLAETGRVSKRPVFLVGVFSGNEKLGESFGASLKEAKTRASVNALMNWYLYSPLEVKLPSDEGYDGENVVVDHGIVIV